MAKIGRFEDLQSWQKGRQLSNVIYGLTEYTKSSRDFRFCDQIQNAAGSIKHNIAEGFDSGINPEFIRFLKMSGRSASEVQSELYLALDRKYITQEELALACNLATEIKKLINGMIAYLRRSKPPTNKTTRL